MKYLEIYPLENCADKISKQLDAIIESNPNMYSKTKKRYKKLAIDLLKSVEKITSILEADSLASVDRLEFDPGIESDMNVKDIVDAVTDVNRKVNSLESFIESSTNSINKATLSQYAKVIESASKHNFHYVEVNECASILYKWFFTRFISNKNPRFRYKIDQIPIWICNIIIVYGKYLSHNNTEYCIDMFNRWCDSIVSSDSVIWAVPYEVYQLSRCVCPENYTMEAVIIGDILMDELFYLLTEDYSPGILCNLDCYPVASSVKLNNPSLLPKIRTRLTNREDLIKDCHLTNLKGGASVE